MPSGSACSGASMCVPVWSHMTTFAFSKDSGEPSYGFFRPVAGYSRSCPSVPDRNRGVRPWNGCPAIPSWTGMVRSTSIARLLPGDTADIIGDPPADGTPIRCFDVHVSLESHTHAH